MKNLFFFRQMGQAKNCWAHKASNYLLYLSEMECSIIIYEQRYLEFVEKNLLTYYLNQTKNPI